MYLTDFFFFSNRRKFEEGNSESENYFSLLKFKEVKIPPFVALKDKHDIVQLLSAKIIMKLTKLTKLMFLQINVKDVKKRERERFEK